MYNQTHIRCTSSNLVEYTQPNQKLHYSHPFYISRVVILPEKKKWRENGLVEAHHFIKYTFLLGYFGKAEYYELFDYHHHHRQHHTPALAVVQALQTTIISTHISMYSAYQQCIMSKQSWETEILWSVCEVIIMVVVGKATRKKMRKNELSQTIYVYRHTIGWN